MYTLDTTRKQLSEHQFKILDEINLMANLPTRAIDIEVVSRGWVVTDLFNDHYLLTRTLDARGDGFDVIYRVYSSYGDIVSCFQSETLLLCL